MLGGGGGMLSWRWAHPGGGTIAIYTRATPRPLFPVQTPLRGLREPRGIPRQALTAPKAHYGTVLTTLALHTCGAVSCACPRSRSTPTAERQEGPPVVSCSPLQSAPWRLVGIWGAEHIDRGVWGAGADPARSENRKAWFGGKHGQSLPCLGPRLSGSARSHQLSTRLLGIGRRAAETHRLVLIPRAGHGTLASAVYTHWNRRRGLHTSSCCHLGSMLSRDLACAGRDGPWFVVGHTLLFTAGCAAKGPSFSRMATHLNGGRPSSAPGDAARTNGQQGLERTSMCIEQAIGLVEEHGQGHSDVPACLRKHA